VLTLTSSVTFLFSLCVILLYLGVCVLCTGADFAIGLAPLKSVLWKFTTAATTTTTNNNFYYYSNSNGNLRNTSLSILRNISH